MQYRKVLFILFVLFSHQRSCAMQELILRHPLKMVSLGLLIPIFYFFYGQEKLFVWACQHNYLPLVRALSHWGADVSLWCDCNKMHQLPLLQAMYLVQHKELVLLLLQKGAGLHTQSGAPNYKVLIDLVCQNNDIVFVEQLHSCTNWRVKDDAFYKACRYGSIDIVKAFFDQVSLDQYSSGLDTAIRNNHLPVVQFLLHKEKSNFASSRAICSSKLLLYFLSLSADAVNYCDASGESLLYAACLQQSYDAVATLLSCSHIELNRKCCRWRGETALHAACRMGACDIVELLLKQPSIKPNIRNSNGNTPLLIAATQSIDLINVLIDSNKVDIKICNTERETFFYVGYCAKKITDPFLLNFFKNFTERKQRKFLSEQLCHSAKMKLDHNYSHARCESAVQQQEEFVSWCVRYGADLNYRNTRFKRPVDYAYDEYEYAKKHLHDRSLDFKHKEEIAHLFLNHTPYVSDWEIYYRLRKNGLVRDVIPLILQYYNRMPFVIERNVAIQFAVASGDYYNKTKYEKKTIKKALLFKKLQSLGCQKKVLL